MHTSCKVAFPCILTFPAWTCPDTQRIYALSKVHIPSSPTHTYQAYLRFWKYGYVLKSMVTKTPATFYGAVVLFKRYRSVSKPILTKRPSTSHGAYILSKWYGCVLKGIVTKRPATPYGQYVLFKGGSVVYKVSMRCRHSIHALWGVTVRS